MPHPDALHRSTPRIYADDGVRWRAGKSAWAIGCALALFLSACGGGGPASESKNDAGNGTSSLPVNATPQIPAELKAALISGDATGLNDPTMIAKHALSLLTPISTDQKARISSLYQNVSTEYDPTVHSQWVLPKNPADSQAFVVGDQGKILASISMANGGRSAGYGVQVLERIHANAMSAHIGAFKRLLGWLVTGDASGALPTTLKVAAVGINNFNKGQGFVKAGIPFSIAACDFLITPACASSVDLLLIGSDIAASDSLESSVRALIAAGKPVLYLHTKNSFASDSGAQILSGMGLQMGGAGGNYWVMDKVAPNRSAASQQTLTDQFASYSALLDQMATNNFSMPYDWGTCDAVYKCGELPSLQTGLFPAVDAMRGQIDAYNRTGENIFSFAGTEYLRSLVLWADVVRKQLRYPMDKVTTPGEFQKAFIADALVAYARTTAVAQTDLGTFAGTPTAVMRITRDDELIDVFIPNKEGFTAIGRMAAPGRQFTLELLEGGTATLSLRLNTQRVPTTRLWEPNRYDRPRFLESPSIVLAVGKPIQLISPYGGTLQLVFKDAQPQQIVSLRVRGVSRHPFLDQSNGEGDTPSFLAALNAAEHDWAEIKIPGVEIHSNAAKMRKVINEVFAGDIPKFLAEIKTYLFEDIYMLAGFNVAGKTLTAHVQAMCTQLAWDCTDAKIHRALAYQHINVDTYAKCGNACSGNPLYDQDTGLNPRTWVESHEIGHNLQKDILKANADRSAEVSNNIFPLHKGWRLLRDLNLDPENERLRYKSAFDMIMAAKADADPSDGAYQRIWGDAAYAKQNGERMAFYIQWVHYWTERQASDVRGWDIITLLYLHQRQFEATSDADWLTNRARLGYSTYATKPIAISGNDNMLIALSLITGRDHRETFKLWGVRFSAEADAQVVAFNYVAVPALFYGNSKRNTNRHATVLKIDMSVANPVWPFRD